VVTITQVDNAFSKLRAAGYFAEQNFYCCQSCAWSAIPEDASNKVVFYHAQDDEYAWFNTNTMEESNILLNKLYLAWAGDCNEIRSILESEGLTVDHNGSEDKRIVILP
jgi:serine/threonine protein phosphatase PrpC